MQNKKSNPTSWIDVGTVHLDAEIWLLPPERCPQHHSSRAQAVGGNSCSVLIPASAASQLSLLDTWMAIVSIF